MKEDTTEDILPDGEKQIAGTAAPAEAAAEEKGSQNPGSDKAEAREELKRIVQEIAREDERPMSANFTLRKILGGEFLTARLLRQQIGIILLIMGFVIVYIANRYSCDKQRIKISRLNKELEEAKFRAMTTASELTKISRESNVLQMLQNNKDSVLHIPSQPPYIINVPEQ